MRKPWGWGSAAMITPKLTIDGYPVPVRWQTNVYPVLPGRRHVVAEASYLWTFGRAEADADVPPGQTVELHYSSPVITFLRGSIGPTEQPRRGALALALLLGLPVALLLVVIVAAVVSSG